MIICISGTPGTGKTTVAKKLAVKYKFKHIDGYYIIEKYKLSEGTDKKRGCIIVDKKKFSSAVLRECKEHDVNYIVDSHLSHNLPKKKVVLCVICKCDLKTLKKRLEKRRYSKSKVEENIQAEIFEICLSEAAAKKHKIIIVDTTKGKCPQKLYTKISRTLK